MQAVCMPRTESLASQVVVPCPDSRPYWHLHRCWPCFAGYTPLHMASGYLHTPVVELLLAYGADPEVRLIATLNVFGTTVR